MADEVLGIQITADATNATRGIREATASISRFNVSLVKLSNTGLTPLAGSFQKQVAAQSSFASGLRKLQPEIEKTSLKFKSGSQSVLNFGRVLQDAPYALNNFGSIANNIDPLFESLRRLKEEARLLSEQTGKTVSTFSLFKKSLMGGAGIGLALSAVTSLITAFSMGMFDNKEAAEENEAALDALNDTLDRSKEKFEALEVAIGNANKLGKVNLDISFGKGLGADLLDLQGGVTGLNEEIFALEENLKVLSKQSVDLEVKLSTEGGDGIREQLSVVEKAYDDTNKKLKQKQAERTLNFRLQEQLRVNAARDAAKEADDIAKNANERFAKLQKERLQLFEEYKGKFKDLGEFTNFDFLPIIDFSKLPKDFGDATKEIKDQLSTLFKDMETAFILNGKKAGVLYGKELSDAIAEELARKKNPIVEALEKGGLKDAKVPIQIELIPPRKQSFEQILGGLKTITFDSNGKSVLGDISNEAMLAAETINSVLTPAFEGMFDAILSGEQPLKAFFDGILDSIAEVIKALVKAAIQAAILSIISNIIAPGAGSSFGQMFGKITGMGGVARPTGIMGGSRAALTVTVGGRISGNSLNLVGSRTSRLNGLFG